ncbi:MAG TPA: SDR family oxidoreductase [Myxococcota bacterium]|nr:SDR family oxidoreductase [Myxococcota bacterium]
MTAARQAVAAITGAGAGFGAAIADQCRSRGYAVAALDIDAAAAERTAATLRAAGGTAIARKVDVSDRVELAGAAEAVRSELGRCDLLFANVGVQQIAPLERFSEQDWQWMLSVNVLGVVHSVMAFLPLLRETRGDRHVVLTSSNSVLAPSPRIGPYIMSKAAVTAFGEVLAAELEGEGIGVTIVFPAGMITSQLQNSRAARPPGTGVWELREEDMKVVSVHSAPTPQDVATPAAAAAGLLEQVLAGRRYVVTHGSSRSRFEARVAALLEAHDRMERARAADPRKGAT